MRASFGLMLGLVPAVCLAGGLNRPYDPVVMRGADLPALMGYPPDQVVGFRYEGGWVQIPVQIDERKIVDYGVVYNLGVVGLTTATYADPDTYCGSDPDPLFDADDELVFMALDAGQAAPPRAPPPSGVLGGVALAAHVSDPLDGGAGYVYLFLSDGSLNPDAGADYVSYAFELLAGPYLAHYDTLDGPNPEDSVISSQAYALHFSDRWVRDELMITAGGANGADILDRHKALFAPGNCVRTEDTFSDGAGAFFCNIDGPVRAIRSYMGANSGPLTQRDHRFYAGREDVDTHLRVHAIDGIMDLFDYSPAAMGMTYQHDQGAGPVTIDGEPDAVAPGNLAWELVTGAQGSLVMALGFETDIPGFLPTSYYNDDATPALVQCTGDAFEYGLSGVWIDEPIPNTDPFITPLFHLSGRRVIYYEAPGRTADDAAARVLQAGTPVDVTVSAWPPGCAADLDGDGETGQADLGILLSAFGSCPGDENYSAPAGMLGGDACVTQADLGVLLSDFGCGG